VSACAVTDAENAPENQAIPPIGLPAQGAGPTIYPSAQVSASVRRVCGSLKVISSWF